MTRRERLERKLEKRREWALKAEQRGEADLSAAHRLADGIPLGQPILVGHHSEKRHRRDLQRIDSKTLRGLEELELAKHHAGKASGLEHALERSVYSDDADAIEQLEARIAENEAERERRKRINALYRKGNGEGLAALGLSLEKLQASLKQHMPWEQVPYPGYSLTNLGARIRSDRERIAEIQRRGERQAAAEAAPNGVVLTVQSGWARVQFAEKPARQVLQALRDAGFRWGSGYWSGEEAKLPPIVRELASAEARNSAAD